MFAVLILLGLLGLWLGTRWIVSGAMGIAAHFKLSHAFVGVAILAVGTDLPEVFVTLKASFLNLQGIESSRYHCWKRHRQQHLPDQYCSRRCRVVYALHSLG